MKTPEFILKLVTLLRRVKISTLAGIATIIGVVWTFMGSLNPDIPFLAECSGAPASDYYLLGPDGTEAQIDARGKGLMPGSWKGKMVLVRSLDKHRDCHSFYVRPVKGELFRISVPSPA